MKFTLKSANRCRLAVISEISDRREDLEITTPACLLYTRGGSVPHLTLDMLQKIPNQTGVIHLNVPSFIEYRETVESFKEGLAKFIGMPDAVTMLTVQDSAKMAPSGYNDKSSVSVWAPSGRVKLDVESYMAFQRAAKPDILEALCDGDTPEGCSKKRVLRAVTRTLQFLDECLEANAKTEEHHSPEIFGVIEGGDMLSERLRSTRETVKRPVSGFVLDSFGEQYMKAETRWRLLDNMMKEIPVNKPRMLPQVGHPLDVLLAVERGVDLFDSSFPYQATESGSALVFTWNCVTEEDSTADLSESSTGLSINLNDKRYSEDFSPVLAGCECYCCVHHTRAYINHLLITKELLAGVLLMSHNLHHYLRFFREIRRAIGAGSFDRLKKHIENQSSTRLDTER